MEIVEILLIIGGVILLIGMILYISNSTGVLRFNKLKSTTKKNITDYLNAYNSKKKIIPEKIVVSFTTTPDRIDKISPMLNSILDQTTKIDNIYLNIPEECKGKHYTIPDEYKDIVNIFTVGRDYGCGTKYIPTLLREAENGTNIILLDDDHIYGNDLIENLIKKSKEFPGKCIYAGNKFNGSSGILIKPEFINKITHEHCDDKWLSDNLCVDKLKINYSKNFKYI
jgi:hypothetical protein